MKNLSKTVAIAAVVSVMFASCGLFGGKKGTCPAYNKVENLNKQHSDLSNN